jgi:polysaccharide pyruvyl transferase WcaK-like protein
MQQLCPACNSTTTQDKNFPSREGFPITINMCGHCGHYFQNIQSYQDVYSSGEFSVEARGSHEPTIEKIKELDKRAMDRVEFYRPILSGYNSVLEIGSSIGSFLHLLKIQGKEVTGLEPDPVYAIFSQKQYFLNQDIGLVENYHPNKIFDLICSFHVIEHIEHLPTFITKISQLLNANGGLLLECPSLEIHSYGSMKRTIWKPHMHYFTLASMYALLARNFKVVELGYYGMSLYVYAVKSEAPTFDKQKFLSLRRKSKNTTRLVKLTPSVKIGAVDQLKLRQLILQPFLQKQTFKKLAHYTRLTAFGAKAILYKKKEEGISPNYATHISYYSAWENAGDTVLSKTVRRVFHTATKNSWSLQHIKTPVDSTLLKKINNGKYLLIGGGGLLLPDSNKNSVSGWQWAVAEDQLNEIKIPLIVYAIGYNYFKGQETNELFVKNLNALVKRADFFSLRNYGSIEKVKELVDKNFHHKIIYQPCPTTVIRNYFKMPEKPVSNKNVGFNLAFDRYEKRFGKDIYLILDQLAITAKRLEESGYNIYCINHLKGDNKFELSLTRRNVTFKSIDLQYTLPQQVINFYNEMELVFGARGHAQMIPFGTNTRIISLGTHDKLKFFLEDIQATDWYDDITQEPHKLSERLLDKFFQINEQDSKRTDALLLTEQEKLYTVTKANLELIRKLIKPR